MERYHIFKLGLAILFYAAYCARPMLVYSLKADNPIQDQPRSQPLGDYYGYYQGLDGKPGIDFPVYSYIPRTAFNCRGVESGYYADLETNCQVFHICEGGKKISFLCPNGTIFQQAELICEWWNKVNCSNSPNLYESSAERLQNDIAKRKLSRRVSASNKNYNHGAVMRMEESSSITAVKNGKSYTIKEENQRRKNSNYQVPEDNDFGLNIAQDESNNRHLARANAIQQNQKYSNHNYEEIKENTQVRKDINKNTGNFLSSNTDEGNKNKEYTNKKQEFVTQSSTTKNQFRGRTTFKTSRISSSVTPSYPSKNTKHDFEVTSYPNNDQIGNNYKENDNYRQTTKNNFQNNVVPSNQNNFKESSDFVTPSYSNKNKKNDFQDSNFQSDNYNRQPTKDSFQKTQYNVTPRTAQNNVNGFENIPQQNHKSANDANSYQFNENNRPTTKNYETQHNRQTTYQNLQKHGDLSTRSNLNTIHPTTQVFGQKTNFKNQKYQNTFYETTKTAFTQRYTDPSGINELKSQNTGFTTPSYQQGQKHKQYNTFNQNFQQTIPYNDETTRPPQNLPTTTARSTAQNNGHNKHVAAQNKHNNLFQIPVYVEKDISLNNDFNNTLFVPLQKTIMVTVPQSKAEVVTVPPSKAEIVTVPPRQAESISIAPQKASSLFVAPQNAQSLPLQGQNAERLFYSTQNSLSTTQTKITTSRPITTKTRNIEQNFRGSSRFNPNDFDDGQPKKQTQIPFEDNSKVNSQNINNYELEFPKHKSELNTNQNNDLDENQITQESASFITSPYNSITNNYKTSVSPYPNHRSTYSDIKPQVTFEAPKMTSISSITPHLVTTQPINNGKPFVGSKVGSTFLPSKGTSTNGATYLPTVTTTNLPTTHEIVLGVLRHSTVSPYGPPESFNTGNTEKTLPPIETQSTDTNPVPTDLLNVGKTGITLQPNVVSLYSSTSVEPLNIYVPDEGSLNLGTETYSTVIPKEVFEPPFVKKIVPLLYSSSQPISTTPKMTNNFVSSTTLRPKNELISVRNNNNNLNQEVYSKYDKDQDKVAIHLSKTLEGQNNGKPNSFSQNSNDYVVTSAAQDSKSTSSPYENGLFTANDFNNQIPLQTTAYPVKSQTEKPRPFAKSLDLESKNQVDMKPTYATYPSYSLSSARPFQKAETTEAALAPRGFAYDNVDNMLNVLKEIAVANKKDQGSDRSGLVIPPSVSPQTLHSLAQYFANELDTDQQVLDPDTKEEFTGLLTQMTVHGYNTLFRKEPLNQGNVTKDPVTNDVGNRYDLSNSVDINSTTEYYTHTTTYSSLSTNTDSSFTTVASTTQQDIYSRSKENNQETNEVLSDNNNLDPPIELRQLARNFSLALSSYLKDPDQFRMSLQNFRPTEPPFLEGETEETDNLDSGDEELLNFSDADLKSSTPYFYPSSPSTPSPTWGYIIANSPKGSTEENPDLNTRGSFAENTAKSVLQDDIKNSLNPDLNTADSQSLNPGYNNNFNMPGEKNKEKTEYPPQNHRTSSQEATKLWQSTLSIDPLHLNDNLITTPLPFTPLETTETSIEDLYYEDSVGKIDDSSIEITDELKELLPLNMNSTEIHGLLLDFMNHTKDDEHSRLQRILKKLNTTEDEFLSKMREIESNPITRRLILLLISECGANITNNIGLNSEGNQKNLGDRDVELLSAEHSTSNLHSLNHIGSTISPRSAEYSTSNPHSSNHIGSTIAPRSAKEEESVSSSFIQLVDPNIKEEDQDARALQLLNALYGIASRFGRKR